MPNALIIDADQSLLELCRAILARDGYEACISNRSDQALDLAYDCQPDILIVNDTLPRVTGGEVCQQIRSDPNFHAIPIIMTSAANHAHDAAYAHQFGVDAILPKPYLPADLLQIVNHLLSAS
jgi:DNA-binding response OmpR family regulator